MSWFRKQPEPAGLPSREVQPDDPLKFLGATKHPLPHGFWVYALFEEGADTPFYVGQSGKPGGTPLVRRLADHISVYKERFHHYKLVRCDSAYQMKLWEDWLINWYQPPENYHGTDQAERERMAANRSMPFNTGKGKVQQLMRERTREKEIG